MSVLESPRIYFKGEMAWDPITTNNYETNYDEDDGQTILPVALNRVAAFRKQAVADIAGQGNWNPHGTHRSTFYNAAVCGFDLGDGVATDDPFASAAVNFLGMLVDLEPFGAFTSQLFFDSMLFGVDGGYRILAPRTSRATARRINFARNNANQMIAGVASVTWTASFAKADGLRIDAFDSRVLKSLASALASDDVLGLTVRFNAYRTVYFDDPSLTNTSPATTTAAQMLTSKINGGGFQPNPARSLLVGVIGPWRKAEPAHEPGDRALIPAANSPLGGAQARLTQTTLTLDLSNSVPEVDSNLTKQPLGPLTVVAIDPASQAITTLGTFPYAAYDRTAYEASAGIVTLPLAAGTAEHAARMDLQLQDAQGIPLLVEQARRAIPATPNLYLDEGRSANATFQIYDRGLPVAFVVQLTLYQMKSDGSAPQNKKEVATDVNGILTLPLSGKAGITSYVPSFNAADAPTGGLDPQVNTYMFARTRPADDNVAALPPTWSNVYSKVLANWNAMAPCMDNWLRLDDPVQIRSYAPILKRLTDPANFESFRFMPVTRDMSPGERTLLYKFLDAPADPKTQPPPHPPEHRDFARLSRAMRGG